MKCNISADGKTKEVQTFGDGIYDEMIAALICVCEFDRSKDLHVIKDVYLLKQVGDVCKQSNLPFTRHFTMALLFD
jgi:hypothetical protein